MNARVPLLAVALLLAPGLVHSASLDLIPSKDNTLYQTPAGNLSSGAGQTLHVGLTNNTDPTLALRRGLVFFEVSGIAPGSIITHVTLKLYCDNISSLGPPTTVQTVHRATASWGEGTSDAGPPGGQGAPAQTGDATWTHRFFNTIAWSTVGGTFSPTVSTQQTIADAGYYVFPSTTQLVQDVQGWVNTPATNFGWFLIGDEAVAGARRYGSRQNIDQTIRPVLHIDFNPPTGVEPVAGHLEFGVRNVQPNPVSHSASVSLALPSSEPATLEVVDLAGRRLAAREVGSLGPGDHLVSFPELAHARAGVYWVRLTQGARVARAKAAVMP